ncbi:MAG: YtoQ family protein [Phycisphaerales bacterium]|nr:YtoQ family protein [Phycisphaerales bacterium]
MPGPWSVYLAGEVHSDWRTQIIEGAAAAELDINWLAPITAHADSDDCGAVILGEPCQGHDDNAFWRDHLGASVNALRTRTMLERADLVVARFGDKYRQWNAAFDAGQAAAGGTPLITLHGPDLDHALKEVDAAALFVCRSTDQVVAALRYAMRGELARG